MSESEPTGIRKLRRIVVGKARDVSDPEIFHHTSLVAFLAWVGLGADGLSSSAYGPEEAYKALGAEICCGQCRCTAQGIIDECCQQSRPILQAAE
mgnify:CR=1 FL=1